MNILENIGSGSTCTSVASTLDYDIDFTCRLLNAGVGIKLLTANFSEIFQLTEAGSMILESHPASLRSAVLMLNEETRDSYRSAVTSSLKSGVSGFKEAFKAEFWEWHSKKENSKKMTQFDEAMKAFSHEIAVSLVNEWAPPSPTATVCDIGGGAGHMVASLATAYPELKGIVFDLPSVVENAKKNIKSMNLEDRVSTIAGSFLEPLPSELSTCDVYYLKFILHDWDDFVCTSILKNILSVAQPNSLIVSTDFILNTAGPNMEMTKKLMDINMMASNPKGARERGFEEYKMLFVEAGVEGEKVRSCLGAKATMRERSY